MFIEYFADIADIVTSVDISVICFPQSADPQIATYFPQANKRQFLGNPVFISVLYISSEVTDVLVLTCDK